MQIDHVLIAAAALDEAAGELAERHGLVAIAGGRHPAWGTANRIVPLGDSYLELVAVVDAATARDSVFGQWVAASTRRHPRPMGWAVRVAALDTWVAAHGLSATPGERVRADGGIVRWRTAGVEQAADTPALPFFIAWEDPAHFPGSAPVRHPAGRARLARLVVEADEDVLAGWLGPHDMPVDVRPGTRGVTSVVVDTDGAEFALWSGK